LLAKPKADMARSTSVPWQPGQVTADAAAAERKSSSNAQPQQRHLNS